MTDVVKLLAGTKTVLLIDWPSRDVPDALARSGFTVVSNDGPDKYNAYEADGGEVRVRDVGQLPKRADLVYTHRPDRRAAGDRRHREVRRREGGVDPVGPRQDRREGSAGCWLPQRESAKAREIVEGAGLTYVEAPYIADAARGALDGVVYPRAGSARPSASAIHPRRATTARPIAA